VLDSLSKQTWQKIDFSQLPGWKHDSLLEAVPAILNSLEEDSNTSEADQLILQELKKNMSDESTVRQFFSQQFQAWEISSEAQKNQGFFTGYYQPSVVGRREKSDRFWYPLYRNPTDLLTIHDLGHFKTELAGHRFGARLDNHRLIPYYTRQEIDSGILHGKNLEICWLESDVEAYFIHIQGSAYIEFEDHQAIQISCSGHNGHSYTSIGKALVDSGEIMAQDISLQAIKQWFDQNPKRKKDLLNQNKSYIFFQEEDKNLEWPLGAQGVPLTAGRSMAVDPRFIPLGSLLWLDIEYPGSDNHRIQQLIVAQDMGSAIKGLNRGDFFWGRGDQAEKYAGQMKSSGTYYLITPKEKL